FVPTFIFLITSPSFPSSLMHSSSLTKSKSLSNILSNLVIRINDLLFSITIEFQCCKFWGLNQDPISQ
ncbi:hypothetical protein GIB67_009170, partial [Kingdonia uniflora]